MNDLQIEQRPSPNCTPGRNGQQPIAVINHVMIGSMTGTIEHFSDPASKASSNYAVGRDGRIVQFVPDGDAAWANGNIRYPNSAVTPWVAECKQQGINPNERCISIEWEGTHRGGHGGTVVFQGQGLHVDFIKGSIPADGFWTPTEVQYQAGLKLIRALCTAHNIPTDRAHVGRHSDVDNVAKWFCPGPGFPLQRLLDDLNAPQRETLHVEQDAARAKGLSVNGPPNISPAVFTQVLQENNSPAAPLAAQLYQACVDAWIDPAVALAFFWHECSLGKAGVVAQYDTNSWGNLVADQSMGNYAVDKTPLAYGHHFRMYRSFLDGLLDWCDLLNGPLYKSLPLAAQIALFAPSGDGSNAPTSYYRTVVVLVRGQDGLGGWLARSGDFEYEGPVQS